jgi:hypothetical protein
MPQSFGSLQKSISTNTNSQRTSGTCGTEVAGAAKTALPPRWGWMRDAVASVQGLAPVGTPGY